MKNIVLTFLIILLIVGGCGYDHPPDVISIGANFTELDVGISGAPTPQTTGYFIMGTWFRNQKKPSDR